MRTSWGRPLALEVRIEMYGMSHDHLWLQICSVLAVPPMGWEQLR